MALLESSIIAYIVYCASYCLAISRDHQSYRLEYPQYRKETLEENLYLGNAWENSGKFEGDMILNERQRLMIIREVAFGGSWLKNGVDDLRLRWPKGVLIYSIRSNDFSREQIEAIKNAMDILSRLSCVKFREYVKNEDHHMVIIKGDENSCYSHVGYQKYDTPLQVINLSAKHQPGATAKSGCFRTGTILHELIHALGFFHMHTSSNRDEYIQVNWENVKPKKRKDFFKYHSQHIIDYNVPYDYASIMHYGLKAHSINGKDTMTPLKPLPENLIIGQRDIPSDSDIKKLNFMYCESMYSNMLILEDKKKKKKENLYIPHRKHKSRTGGHLSGRAA